MSRILPEYKDAIDHGNFRRFVREHISHAFISVQYDPDVGHLFLTGTGGPFSLIMEPEEFEALVTEVRQYYIAVGDFPYRYNEQMEWEVQQRGLKQRYTPPPHYDIWSEYGSGKTPEPQPLPPIIKKSTHGYVYLISSGDVFKIGLSSNPDRRVYTEISPVMPYPVDLIHIIETEDMYSLEAQLHARFVNKRLNGEWFALTPADVDYLKSL